MTSLRTRAVAGGIIWTVLVIVLGLASLSSFMISESKTRFIELLQTRHTQAVVVVANNSQNPQNFVRAIGDSVYQRPFSGQYWQIEDNDGRIFVSPSLVDGLLPRSKTTGDATVTRRFSGPGGEPLIGTAQRLAVDDGSIWYVQVASSFDRLEEEEARVRKSLLSAFAIIAAVGILGALAQVALMLQPLNALRKDVSTRWEDEDGLDVNSYPVEVAPLVVDINSLLARNRDIIGRSRRQAADLAHAIKTPSAIMRNELDMLRSQGVDVQDFIDVLDRLDAQLKRSLARVRADASEGSVGSITNLDEALGRMQRAFTALAENAGKKFIASFDAGLRVRMDQSDFEEVIGNLLDNALKWGASTVHLTAVCTDGQVVLIDISDDGPGIPEEEIPLATLSGQRLDVSKPGTGLGLAIASDLLHAYGGQIVLGKSEDLGGLAIHIRVPIAGGRRPDKNSG
jgi:signal transduction histidine kinase